MQRIRHLACLNRVRSVEILHWCGMTENIVIDRIALVHYERYGDGERRVEGTV